MAWGARRGVDDVLHRVRSNDATLQSLYLMGTRSFGEREAQALCEAIIGNTVLTELNISSHAVTPAMAAAFADMLSHPACSVTSLSLGNRTFGDQGLSVLSSGIKANTSLQHLDLEAKGLSAAVCAELAVALAGHASIRRVTLAQNELRDEGITQLAPGLLKVRALDIRSIGLGGEAGWKAVGRVLQEGSLQVLHCEGNSMDEAGAAALAPALASCTSLRHLHMARCGLSPSSAQQLAASLPPQLETLDWSECGVGPEGAAGLAGALEAGRCAALRCLVLCGCRLGDEGVVTLARGLAGATGSVGSCGGSSTSASKGGGCERDPILSSCKAAAAASASAAAPAPAAAAGSSSPVECGLALDLGGNPLSRTGVAALRAVPPGLLASLRLHGCQLGNAGAEELANIIRTRSSCMNPGEGSNLTGSVVRINASNGTSSGGGSGSGGGGSDAFSGLQELDVSCCDMHAEGLLALLGALRDDTSTCASLRLVVLAGNDGLESGQVVAAVEGLQEARQGLVIVRRAADSGELGRRNAG